MDYKEFNTQIRKARGPQKNAKVRNSWGVYHAYKHMRKNGWYDIGRPLKEKEFYAIIRGINDLLAENISNGIDVRFPWAMGCLEVHKLKCGVSLVDGKLKNTYPISWSDTLKLWYENEEARREKALVRYEHEYTYFIQYNKHDAQFVNQCYYQFAPNRFARVTLQNNVKKGKIETLW